METDDKVLEAIFYRPEIWRSLRDIARQAKVAPNSVRKVVAKQKKKEILESRKDSNRVLVRAAVDKRSYIDKKRVYNLEKIYDLGIADFLDKRYSPQAVVLFGSYSRGEDISRSDIDIAVITKNKKRADLSRFEAKLQRKISLSLFTQKEISEEFFSNLVNGIVLRGFLKI